MHSVVDALCRADDQYLYLPCAQRWLQGVLPLCAMHCCRLLVCRAMAQDSCIRRGPCDGRWQAGRNGRLLYCCMLD